MQYVMQDISQDSVGLVSNLFIILEVWPNDHITVMYILYSSLWLEIHFLVIQNKWITHIKLSQVYSVNVSVYVEYVMLWRFTPCVLCGIRTETVQGAGESSFREAEGRTAGRLQWGAGLSGASFVTVNLDDPEKGEGCLAHRGRGVQRSFRRTRPPNGKWGHFSVIYTLLNNWIIFWIRFVFVFEFSFSFLSCSNFVMCFCLLILLYSFKFSAALLYSFNRFSSNIYIHARLIRYHHQYNLFIQ